MCAKGAHGISRAAKPPCSFFQLQIHYLKGEKWRHDATFNRFDNIAFCAIPAMLTPLASNIYNIKVILYL